MTEKECEACEKNRKGVYATPFGADHHHARITELERENAQYRARKRWLESLLLLRKDGRPEWQARMEDAEHECDEARAAIRAFIADYEVNGSLPNYALNRLRRLLDSSESPPRADMGGDSSRLGESPTDGRATLGQVARGADAAPTKPNAKRGGPKR